MSGYLPLSSKSPSLLSPTNPNLSTPFSLFHGQDDPLVQLFRGKASRDKLKELGFAPEWKDYKGLPHSANMEEIEDVGRFLGRVLPSE